MGAALSDAAKPDGRIAEHIDHSDSGTQVYMRVPVLGWLIGLVRDRFRIRGGT